MRAWAVSIGSELLAGQITDTNATFLAQECVAAGIDLIRVTQVGDDQRALVDTLQRALDEANVVICTGGVGPTDDDLTREAIAEVVGETPEMDPALLTELRSFFANRGQQMPERNAKQAWTIPSSRTLVNPVGTAPGWIVTVKDTHRSGTIIAMPGVPREMHRMWREQALPAIQQQAGASAIRSTTIKTLGIGESAAEDHIHDLVLREQPVMATYAKDDGVHIRVTATTSAANVAEDILNRGINDVYERLGEYIWGRDDDTLPRVLVQQLEHGEATIALIEAGSGGAFAGMLTSVQTEDQTHPLLEARVLPLDLDLDDDAAKQRADELSKRAQSEAGATLGLAIVVNGTFDSRHVLHGKAVVAISESGHSKEVTHFGLRASIEDVHRRSALHAADRLRRLIRSPVTTG